jgi:hypothetical protein
MCIWNCACHEGRWRIGRVAPLFHTLSIKWRWPSAPWKRGWVGLIADLDALQISCTCWRPNHSFSFTACSAVTLLTTLSRFWMYMCIMSFYLLLRMGVHCVSYSEGEIKLRYLLTEEGWGDRSGQNYVMDNCNLCVPTDDDVGISK